MSQMTGMKMNKEITVGVLLTALLAGILTVVHNRSVHHHSPNSFVLSATFTKADGLMPNGEVRLAGIQVGQIGKQFLADNGYQVRVELVFDHPMDIPVDSSVSIETDGIMGAKHIEILPGGDEEMMQNGDSFSYTQDSLILNELLDKVNAFMKEKKSKEDALKNNQQQEVL
ncbi:MAG: MCE family protein [Alphaproteobacteria bacterium]|nr:MCE family protein [Alphaproteobacteria bacterium]